MRFLLTTALILASGTALASSITPLTSHGGNGSLVTKSCSSCPPLKPKEKTSTYTVPVLESGPQKTEIVEINGEKKLVRTEDWLGGSPVVHISKVYDWSPVSSSMRAGSEGDGIDRNVTVGAVGADATAVVNDKEPAPLDVSPLELRLEQ